MVHVSPSQGGIKVTLRQGPKESAVEVGTQHGEQSTEGIKRVFLVAKVSLVILINHMRIASIWTRFRIGFIVANQTALFDRLEIDLRICVLEKAVFVQKRLIAVEEDLVLSEYKQPPRQKLFLVGPTTHVPRATQHACVVGSLRGHQRYAIYLRKEL